MGGGKRAGVGREEGSRRAGRGKREDGGGWETNRRRSFFR